METPEPKHQALALTLLARQDLAAAVLTACFAPLGLKASGRPTVIGPQEVLAAEVAEEKLVDGFSEEAQRLRTINFTDVKLHQLP